MKDTKYAIFHWSLYHTYPFSLFILVFIVIAACVMAFEARENSRKVKPNNYMNKLPEYTYNVLPRRSDVTVEDRGTSISSRSGSQMSQYHVSNQQSEFYCFSSNIQKHLEKGKFTDSKSFPKSFSFPILKRQAKTEQKYSEKFKFDNRNIVANSHKLKLGIKRPSLQLGTFRKSDDNGKLLRPGRGGHGPEDEGLGTFNWEHTVSVDIHIPTITITPSPT